MKDISMAILVIFLCMPFIALVLSFIALTIKEVWDYFNE